MAVRGINTLTATNSSDTTMPSDGDGDQVCYNKYYIFVLFSLLDISE